MSIISYYGRAASIKTADGKVKDFSGCERAASRNEEKDAR
jgi:hypothetical protein